MDESSIWSIEAILNDVSRWITHQTGESAGEEVQRLAQQIGESFSRRNFPAGRIWVATTDLSSLTLRYHWGGSEPIAKRLDFRNSNYSGQLLSLSPSASILAFKLRKTQKRYTFLKSKRPWAGIETWYAGPIDSIDWGGDRLPLQWLECILRNPQNPSEVLGLITLEMPTHIDKHAIKRLRILVEVALLFLNAPYSLERLHDTLKHELRVHFLNIELRLDAAASARTKLDLGNAIEAARTSVRDARATVNFTLMRQLGQLRGAVSTQPFNTILETSRQFDVRHITLTSLLPDTLGIDSVAGIALFNALGNLIQNASDHNASVRIAISAILDSTGVEIRVGDNGKGLPGKFVKAINAEAEWPVDDHQSGLKSVLAGLKREGISFAVEYTLSDCCTVYLLTVPYHKTNLDQLDEPVFSTSTS